MKSRETDTSRLQTPAFSSKSWVRSMVAFSKVVALALPNWQCLHYNPEARAEGATFLCTLSTYKVRYQVSTEYGSIRLSSQGSNYWDT